MAIVWRGDGAHEAAAMAARRGDDGAHAAASATKDRKSCTRVHVGLKKLLFMA